MMFSMGEAAWNSPIYQRTALIVLGVIFVSGLIVWFFREKNHYFVTSWASINRWLIAAPILFGLMGLPSPWPLIVLTIIAITGAKVFFHMIGMFQHSTFVLITYGGIFFLALGIHYRRDELYNLAPMLVLGTACMVPLVKNSWRNMVQYISLTLLTFIFLGWGFMHLALIMHRLPNGLYQAMYLIILTEVCDNTSLALSRHLGNMRLLPNLNPLRTVLSTVVAFLATLFVAAGMKFLLPDKSDIYWLTSGIIAGLVGVIGNLVLSAIRKDLGIKLVGPFILGRSDFLNRIERLIFTAPIYYYVMIYLMGRA